MAGQACNDISGFERQTQALLPGTYFLITFTLPAELRPLA